MADEPKYDVAISFLAKNETLAREITDKLAGLNVFFFPRQQEELVGTDGLDSMREPFLTARVAVVLYDTDWGKTKWTRVEETAIKDRCLNKGWDSLVFAPLSVKVSKPTWVPNTHIRFNLEDYPVEQLAGAIKVRVQEQGGSIKKPDAMSEGMRVQRARKLAEDRERLFRDRDWIENKVHRSVRDTIIEVIRLVEELKKSGFNIRAGSKDMECVLRYSFVSFAIYWRQSYSNTIADDDTDLRLAEFSGAVLIPGEQGIVWHDPIRLREHYFKPEVSETRELVWVESMKERFSPLQLADRIVRIFLDLVSRADEGKIQRPDL